MLFAGQTALVTASGAGIGRAIARKLAREGAAVVVSDIADDAAAETVRLIEQDGGKAAFLHAFADHDATIAFYRGLGFEVRARMTYTVLAEAEGDEA